jgi:prefoldin subunit 5
MDEILLKEVSRRNTLSFEEAIRLMQKAIEEQHKRIDTLQNALTNMSERMNSLENMVLIQKVRSTGSGPSVRET